MPLPAVIDLIANSAKLEDTLKRAQAVLDATTTKMQQLQKTAAQPIVAGDTAGFTAWRNQINEAARLRAVQMSQGSLLDQAAQMERMAKPLAAAGGGGAGGGGGGGAGEGFLGGLAGSLGRGSAFANVVRGGGAVAIAALMANEFKNAAKEVEGLSEKLNKGEIDLQAFLTIVTHNVPILGRVMGPATDAIMSLGTAAQNAIDWAASRLMGLKTKFEEIAEAAKEAKEVAADQTKITAYDSAAVALRKELAKIDDEIVLAEVDGEAKKRAAIEQTARLRRKELEAKAETARIEAEALENPALREVRLRDADTMTRSINSQVDAWRRAKIAEDERTEAQKLADKAAAEAKAAEEARQKSIDGIIKGLQEQAVTYGMTAGEIAAYRLQQQGATEDQLKAARVAADTITSNTKAAETQQKIAAIHEQSRTPLEKYYETLKNLNDLRAKGLSEEDYTRAAAAARADITKGATLGTVYEDVGAAFSRIAEVAGQPSDNAAVTTAEATTKIAALAVESLAVQRSQLEALGMWVGTTGNPLTATLAR